METPTPVPVPTPTAVSPFAFLNSADPTTHVLVTIVEALLVLLVALALARYGKGWMVRLLMRGRVNVNVATLIGNLVQVLIVLIGITTALQMVGVPWASLIAVLGAAGLAISLSMQDLLKNVIAGIFILMEQPFRIGDRISVKEVTGVVQGIELRTTILRTDDHLQVVVPNSTVLNEIITNRSTNDVQRAIVQMSIKRSRIGELSEQIKSILEGLDQVAERPEPVIVLDSVLDGILEVRVEFWANAGSRSKAIPAVVETLQARYPDANLKVVS
ncbi:MAG: mechanosensitive ion channel family protein [Chloroflexota bacterium]